MLTSPAVHCLMGLWPLFSSHRPLPLLIFSIFRKNLCTRSYKDLASSSLLLVHPKLSLNLFLALVVGQIERTIQQCMNYRASSTTCIHDRKAAYNCTSGIHVVCLVTWHEFLHGLKNNTKLQEIEHLLECTGRQIRLSIDVSDVNENNNASPLINREAVNYIKPSLLTYSP